MILEFRRFFRYDFAVTQVFLEMINKYYGIAVSAHILSYTPTSVVQLLNDTQKPFFIDPMTFVCARDLDVISKKGKVRSSYKKLLAEYGPPFDSCINGYRISPTDFKDNSGKLDDTKVSDVCRRVLDFQKTKCSIPTAFPKYDQLLRKGKVLAPASPSFLVAPYFFAARHGDDWYNISLRMARISKTMKDDRQLYAVIFISSDILWDDSQVSNIVNDYADFDGYLIWASDLDEENASSEVSGLKMLISKLSSLGKPVYSLYGGYLCDLLSKFGLTGYSSGICYGESRSVDTKGGGAGNRYYIPFVHVKISEDLTNLFFAESKKNAATMCTCGTCSAIQSSLPTNLSAKDYSDKFFAQMDFLDYRRHFVNVKSQEAHFLAKSDRSQIATALDTDINTAANIDTFNGQPRELSPRHLRNWRTLFT
jgi:hypothetical protein